MSGNGQVKLSSGEMRQIAADVRRACDQKLSGVNTVKAGGAELAAAGIKSTFGTTFTQKMDEHVAKAITQKNRGEDLASALEQLANEQDQANQAGKTALLGTH